MTRDAAPKDQLAENEYSESWFRRKRRVILILAGISVILIAALTVFFVWRSNEQPEPDPVAATVPVAISHLDVPKKLKIGVVVTLGQGRAEGAEWQAAAQGARVAQYRLAMGGNNVELVVEDDRGTVKGGAEAIARLSEKGVSGVVVASSGAHIDGSVEAAAQAKIPVILPYAASRESWAETPSVWSMDPGTSATVTAINDSLEAFSHPVLLEVGATGLDGVDASETLRPERGDLEGFADEVARRTGADLSAHGAYAGGSEEEDGEERADSEDDPQPLIDALVIDGHPSAIARLVAALEARNVSVPIMLSPAALSPGFTSSLSEHQGTVSPNLRTIGVGAEDSAALGRNAGGRAMSAYLQSLRQLAEDPNAMNLTEDAPFLDSAPWADVRSHDAILALATAAARGESSDPVKVLEGFEGLELSAADGVAGSNLSFGSGQTVSDDLHVLYATGQELGLRPQDPENLILEWFVEPAA